MVSWQQDAKVMGLVGLAHGTSHFCQLLLAPLFPFFVHDFGLSYTQLGSLLTVFFVISGLGQAFLAGFIVDKWGPLPALFASLVCFIFAALLAANAQGYSGLLYSAVLAGVGNAAFHPVNFSILNHKVSPPRLGYAMSIHALLGNVGWAMAGVFLIGIATSTHHWRLAYWAAAGAVALISLFLFWNRDKLRIPKPMQPLAPAAGHPVGQKKASPLFFLKFPVVWACFAFFFFSIMVLTMVQSFLSPVLKVAYGLSLPAAASVVTAYLLCAALGVGLGGFVIAKHTKRSEHVVAACTILGALLMFLCALHFLSIPLTVAAIVLTGITMGIAVPSRDLMVKDVAPPHAMGRIYGMVYSGLDAGPAVAPLLFGYFMDRGWYSGVFYAAALALLLSFAVAWAVLHWADTGQLGQRGTRALQT